MHHVMKLICDEGHIDAQTNTVMHYGKMDCLAKTTILSNINDNWRCMVVMTNNSVTTGLNFNPRNNRGQPIAWFDSLYVCLNGY